MGPNPCATASKVGVDGEVSLGGYRRGLGGYRQGLGGILGECTRCCPQRCRWQCLRRVPPVAPRRISPRFPLVVPSVVPRRISFRGGRQRGPRRRPRSNPPRLPLVVPSAAPSEKPSAVFFGGRSWRLRSVGGLGSPADGLRRLSSADATGLRRFDEERYGKRSQGHEEEHPEGPQVAA